MRPTIGAIGTSNYRINGKAFIRQRELSETSIKNEDTEENFKFIKNACIKWAVFSFQIIERLLLMTLNEGMNIGGNVNKL